MKSARLYLIYFQWSAVHPQEGDRILCSFATEFRAEGRRGTGFRDQESVLTRVLRILQFSGSCENLAKGAPAKESRKSPP
jgi:hypothetical protein